MSSLFLFLSLFVGVLAQAPANKRASCESAGLADLPLELLKDITDRVADPASVAHLSQSSRHLHDALRPRLGFRSLFHHSVRGASLSERVRAYLRYVQDHRHAAPIAARHVTHAEALGLYDRLLDCRDLRNAEKLTFLRVLTEQVTPFADVIWGADFRKCPAELADGVRLLWTQPPPVSWHVNIVTGAASVTDRLVRTPLPDSGLVEEVRKLHSPPFNAVFPDNADFAGLLLQYLCNPDSPHFGQPDPALAYEFQTHNQNLLMNSVVLLDLLRHQIRFDLVQFLMLVMPLPELLPQLYPLLRKPSLRKHNEVSNAIVKPCKKLLDQFEGVQAIALVRIPEVRDGLLLWKKLFVDLLYYAIAQVRVRFVEFICAQPYAADVINGVPGRPRPLHAAFRQWRCLPVLLQVPGVDLVCLCPVSGRSAATYFFNNRVGLENLLERVPSDKLADLIRANPDVTFQELEKFAGTSRGHLANEFLRQNFMPEFINHRYGNDNRTLLHWAVKAADSGMFRYILQVRNLDVTLLDADGHVAFHYVTDFGFFHMHGLGSLYHLLRTDPHRFCTLISHLFRDRKHDWLRYLVDNMTLMSGFVSPKDGCTLLHIAFQRNDIALVAQLLTIPGIVIDCRDHAGRVPFSNFTPIRESVTALSALVPAAQVAALVRTDSALFVSKLIQQLSRNPDFFPFLIEQPLITEILCVPDAVTNLTLFAHAIRTRNFPIARRLLEISADTDITSVQ